MTPAAPLDLSRGLSATKNAMQGSSPLFPGSLWYTSGPRWHQRGLSVMNPDLPTV